jgi:hypothetical protein
VYENRWCREPIQYGMSHVFSLSYGCPLRKSSGGANLSRDAMFPHGCNVQYLEPRIDRLAFEGKHAEDALVHTAQGFTLDESLKRFDAEREFSKCHRSLRP